MHGIAGKVAVVAGGATGIGAEAAARLATEGAQVVVADLNGEGAQATAERISQDGGVAEPVTFDIAEEASVNQLFQATVDRFGGVDFLFNVAADLSPAVMRADTDAVAVDLAVWDRTMAVDLRGYLLTTRCAIPLMLKRGGGAIVNTSSGAVYLAEPIRVCYGVAKLGVTALTRHVATRWGREGIRCNAIAPGCVVTDAMRSGPNFAEVERSNRAATPSPRLGEPNDIAAMVALLFSDEGSFINGQVISVDGGITMRS